MPQIKKTDVRDAILRAAFEQFSEVGYNDTAIPAIARAAEISTANVYRYFPSKLAILYTLYEPWLVAHLDALEKKLTRIGDPTRRLEQLVLALWRDLPRDSNGFANNVMQALSTSRRNDEYDPRLRRLFQDRIAGWIGEVTGLAPAERSSAAAIVLMAFDGFAMNAHVESGIACGPAMARFFARSLLTREAGETGSERRA